MENTARPYDVLIFPYPKSGDTPSSEIHVEVTSNFKEFRNDVNFWLEMFGGNRFYAGGDYKFWIDDGGDEFSSRCDEAEVILSLLYCCKNHEVVVKEICYQGSKYTDISDIKFLEGFEENMFGDIGQTYPVQLHAKKNGQNMLLYFFGPYLSTLDVDDDDRENLYFDNPSIRMAYPLSYGIVEAEEKQRFYAGTFFYHCYFEDLGDDEPFDFCRVYDYDEGVEVFLETDGKSVTFSMLLDGKLHKKISVDDKKAVFYSVLCSGKLLERSSFWQYTDMQDVVFEKDSSGSYLYTGESEAVVQKRLSNVFLPPQTPELDSLDIDTAHRLCEEYIKALYPAAQKVSKLCATMEMRTKLQERLKSKVKGQDMAVEKFVDGYIRYRIRGKVPGKPAGLYLFAGPPGTGKTYLAETFAKDVADEGYQYKRFDMSAYGGGSGDSVSGLVGFEPTWKEAQPGQLTDFVRKNPKCILLFDEIEKASKPVRLLFLSILEGAVLTDKYYDKPVSFEDAILIFTTNEGKDLYEDNREANLTALPDSAVLDGLHASNFAPELISRFMSGTIIVFNHLSYLDMSDIFKDSLRTAVEQIGRESLNFDLKYDDKLSKLYLLSKGDGIDARFISANTRKTVEDYFLGAMDFMRKSYFEELKKLGHAKVSVEVSDEMRPYFEMTDRPRVLGYIEKGAEVYTKRPRNRKQETLQQLADCVWAEDRQSLQEYLEKCNWNSRKKEDKYDAILIDLGRNARRYRDTEGYRCLKAVVEAKPNIPIIVVDRGAAKEKAPLIALGVTDFVRGWLKKAQSGDQEAPGEDQRQECLVLDGTALRTILDRQHFLKMARELARKGQRISSEVTYDYKKKTGILEICFTDLHVGEAEEENAESRRQNKKYLLVEKPQVRLQDIFSAESVKDDMKRCIDNIKNPGKYTQSGARLITGILMYGAPGMGKTMFAKAMAFESGAAFISAVGSDFLNGDGVVKMEEMFQTARRKKPCILFIDEFDAISKNRGGQLTGGQEIVLEKFLKEMDGLETDNEGVYVVGATNYPLAQLDGAVLRRFSTKIPFPYPTMEDRQKFLLRVLEKKDLKDKISERAANTLVIQMYEKIRTYSEIETFIEESIARAVYEEKPVTEKFLFDRIHEETDGAVRQGTNLNTYMATAYHEAGHAVLQYYFGGELAYVTIVPRGNYGGYTMAPFRTYTGQDFLARICISFAGRIAEMNYMEHISKAGSKMGINVGASSDLQIATQFAYEYVCRYGLSERTMVVPGVFMPLAERYPEAVLPEAEKEAIWTSVKQVLEQQQQNTRKLLQQYWGEVEALAYSLIYMQELTGEKAERVIRTRTPYVEECCFWDSDVDYSKAVSDRAEIILPCGYPIYPYYPQTITQLEEKHLTETDSKHYFYAVKKARGGLLLTNNLQEAFSEAYRNYAVCRRFTSEKAAREYLQMLEIKVFRQGEECFAGFYADARAEMESSRAAVKDLIVLEQGEKDMFQKLADEAGVSLAPYLMEVLVDDFLDKYEDAYRVIQVYDEELKQELTAYMDALDYQRYRRNAGYEN